MQYDLSNNPVLEARPFLKWAGGKKQLIETIESRFPDEIKSSRKIEKYFEPFVGGGALFFYLMSNYKISEAYIYDINRELILTYNAIKNNPKELIKELKALSEEYVPKGQDERKEMFLDIRQKFNDAIDIDGVILTKADADSKGGASLSIGYVIKKPIMFLGIGQGYDDIKEYDPEWMLNQLFSEEGEMAEA